MAGGVRLFDSGRDPQDQTSLTRERGIKRRARRQPRARRWRKQALQKLLAAAGISGLPATLEERAWQLRAKAAAAPVEPTELGVVLLHMQRHRGFRSNLMRQEPPSADGKPAPNAFGDEDEESGFWHAAERNLRQRMADARVPTVGCLLAADIAAGRPVRMRYNASDTFAPTRALIAEEFDVIRGIQEMAHSGLDWPVARELVLEQRPIRSPEAGRCEFFPDEERAHRALPSAQEYRIRQTLANLRIPQGYGVAARPLSVEEFDGAMAVLSQCRYLTWPRLRGMIGLKGKRFTIEETAGAAKKGGRGIEGHQADVLVGSLVPGWQNMTIEQRDDLVGNLWTARQRRRDLLEAERQAVADIRGDAVEALADVIQFEMPTGRMSLSLKAARAINRELGAAVPWHEAVKIATGMDHSDRRPVQRLSRLPYYAAVMPGVGMNASGDPSEPNAEIRFGRVMNISVHIALNETRKIVNALLGRYGRPPRLIVVETTRELKAGTEERQRIIREQAKRERENEAIDRELKESGGWLANARERRMRYRLWLRQNRICPYSGSTISGADLLTSAYEVDHVIPRARGGRDTEANMVLCEAASNRGKGERTPHEAFGEAWEPIRDHFLAGIDKATRKVLEWRLGPEAVRVAKEAPEEETGEDDWAPRQLIDTSYTARMARDYLVHVVPEGRWNGVVATRGRLTGWLRTAWDLPKHRADHRSHFVDAAVIAVTDRGIIHRLNTLHGRQGSDTLPDPKETTIDEPYTGFRSEVIRRFERVWPSIRPNHDEAASGALHAETLYGVRSDPDAVDRRRLVLRKPVHNLFRDAHGKLLPDPKVQDVLDSFASQRMRERFLTLVADQRDCDSSISLAEACLTAASHPSWGPRGMTGNTVFDGSSYPPGQEGIVWDFRGNPGTAVRTKGNAIYEVWEVPGRNGQVRWRSRVLTRYGAANRETSEVTGARLVMRLRQGDLLYWPRPSGERLFKILKMRVSGALHLWPARYTTGEKVAADVAKAAGVKLAGRHGITISAKQALEFGMRPATLSVLGRLRIQDQRAAAARIGR